MAQAHYPSSFGMTFCVDGEAKALRVDGHLGPVPAGDEGRPDRRADWQAQAGLEAVSRGRRASNLPLKDGPIRPTSLDAECPEVYVQGQIRKRDTHFVVTLFLVNGQPRAGRKDAVLPLPARTDRQGPGRLGRSSARRWTGVMGQHGPGHEAGRTS